MSEKEKKQVRKTTSYRFLTRFLLKTVILLAALIILLTVVFGIFRMSGNTMSPFVRDGDLCIFYRLDKIYLNDVVLYVDDNGNKKVGRVVASGGQTVDFPKNGGYQVNDYEPTEENPYKTYVAEKGNIKYPLKLKDNEYFILNDFRKITTDSRELGANYCSL